MNPLQGDDWKLERLGKVGASDIADLMAKTKTGYGASRANLMARLICERLTGKQAEQYQSAAMTRGIELEDEAVMAYEFETGRKIERVGRVPHPQIENTGASPDGLVETDGLAEFKCPMSATHLDYLLTQEVPTKYHLQIQWQLECTGRQWCDFVSYDANMPPHLRLFIKRANRDEALIKIIRDEVEKFLTELERKLELLSKVNAN